MSVTSVLDFVLLRVYCTATFRQLGLFPSSGGKRWEEREPNPVGPLERTSVYRHMYTCCTDQPISVDVTVCHVTVSGCRRSFCPVMLWSVCVYAALIAALWFAYSQGFFDTVNGQSFDNIILRYQDVAYHLIDLAVPLNNWREARKVAAYMASWSAFQVINN